MGQLSAVTGRTLKPNYVAKINAQTPYLRSLYQQKDDDEYNERVLAQREKEADTNTALSLRSLEDQKKQAKKANLIGLGQLGTSAYLGYKGNQAYDSILGGDTGVSTSAGTALSLGEGGINPADVMDGVTSGTAAPSIFSRAIKSVASPTVLGSAGLGILAGQTFGGSTLEKSAIGAGVGGLANYAASGGLKTLLSGGGFGGGDIVSSFTSALLGGAGGLF